VRNIVFSSFQQLEMPLKIYCRTSLDLADYSPNEVFSSYKYRQASDFWYLTGFEEPDSAIVLGTELLSSFLFFG
jgi:hypothetical protein